MKCELCGKEFQTVRPRAAATVLLQVLPPEGRLSSEKEPAIADGREKDQDQDETGTGIRPRPAELRTDDGWRHAWTCCAPTATDCRKAMDDTSTPANALPAISRQPIDVCERIESLQGGGLTDLLDDEEDEVTDDVGASIV